MDSHNETALADLTLVDGRHGHDEPCPFETECAFLRELNSELATAKQLNEAVVNSIPSSILIFDRGLRLIYANEQFFQQWQRTRDELGCTLEELLPPQVIEREGWKEMFLRVLETGEPIIHNDFAHESAHRGPCVISFRLSRLDGRTETDHKLLFLLDDVSEKESLQRQLVQSEKLAAMGMLSAGVAHELRTPLSVIRLAAYDVRETLAEAGVSDAASGEVDEQLAFIEKNVLQCNEVINNLLAFARESPRHPIAVDLGALVNDCVALARKEMKNHDIQLHLDLQPAPRVWAEPDALKQVVSNLVVNALQSMPEGGDLYIALRADDRWVRLMVQDTGSGIPRELQDRIFDPFFTTKEPGKGTGLGLSICRRIIDRMGGSIRVDSRPDRGATFTVRVPADATDIEKGKDSLEPSQ